MTITETLSTMRAFGGLGNQGQGGMARPLQAEAPPGAGFGWARGERLGGFRGSGLEYRKGFDPINNPEDQAWWEEVNYRRGKENEWWLATDQMDRIGEYEARARNQFIPQMYGGRLGTELDVLGAGRQYSQRTAYDDIVAGGGAPSGSVYRSLMTPEMDRGYFSDAATRVGAVQTGQAQELMGLNAATTGARGEVEQYYDSLRQADQYGRDAISASRDAARSAGLGAGIGGGLSALGMVGGALIMSDRALKTDIKKVGRHKGHQLYSWKWKETGEPGFGVIAQDIEKTNPEAVFKAVDYSKLFGL